MSSALTICCVIQSTTSATFFGLGLWFIIGRHFVAVEHVDDFTPVLLCLESQEFIRKMFINAKLRLLVVGAVAAAGSAP
ncbi:MAG: hypothetical protein H6824_11420 [Planctomycetaceae bacterium]|nr:hypothetical protein [Planctomycetaceae bacterium]